jgi:pSer/pThr/pTyr-binding forkhead associated (FHA) protein
MSENKPPPAKKSISADWFVRGVLSKIGETFDRLTGRNWKPSSSLATSEVIERLKSLLDAEAKDVGGGRKFVPHNVKLKMQWDKFSTDSEQALGRLENELLIAVIDHINDRRYYTYAPLKLEIKPDYFTEGVKLSASFDKFSEDEGGREAAVNVTIPDLKNIVVNPPPEIPADEPEKEIYIADFTVNGKPRRKELAFAERQRLSVGRTKENDLWLDEASVSKIHAALVLNSEKHLMVADTGSTNGTFINNQRIAYGRAFVVKDGDKLKFGTVEVALEHVVKEVAPEAVDMEESEKSVAEIAPKINPEVTEVLSVEKIRDGEKSLVESRNTNAESSKDTEILSPTEQRIVLDLDK